MNNVQHNRRNDNDYYHKLMFLFINVYKTKTLRLIKTLKSSKEPEIT